MKLGIEMSYYICVENQKLVQRTFNKLKELIPGGTKNMNSISTDAQSLYVPILGLEKSTLIFPTPLGRKVF